MNIEFTINGNAYTVAENDVPVDTSLAVFVRNHAMLTGTKQMCREAGCGACIVMVKGGYPATKKDDIRAVNSVSENIFVIFVVFEKFVHKFIKNMII